MSIIIEAFFICLLASMIWAPIVFLAADRLTHKSNSAFADKLWPIALMASALPAIFAPVAAMLGLSLRSNSPLPPLAMPSSTIMPTMTRETIAAPTPTLELATVFETAAVLYFYGFLLFLTLGFIRMIWFSYRVHYAYDIDEPKLEAGLEDWRQRIGVKCSPRYAFSDAVSSVCVHGFVRPVILMPMDLLDRVSLQDAILMGAHEMAHIKRGDTRLFALCTAARAVFWFNPFMQRIAACANLAAEQAADALVIARGAERRKYAHCFVQGLRFAAGSPQLGRDLVPSFTPFDKRSRRERLNAILSDTHRRAFLTTPQKISLVLSIVAAAALAFAQAAFAVAPRPAKDALPTAPLKGTITMPFGELNNVLGEEVRAHKGIDIKAAHGSVIRAAGGGKIIDATNLYRGQAAWGNVVVIDHGHGLVTRYAHLDSYRVKKGEAIGAGDIIGTVGSTGKSTGPHLHFEVIQDGLEIDPAPVLAAKPMAAPAPLSSPMPTSAPTIIAPTLKIVPAPPLADEPPAVPIDERIERKFVRRLNGLDTKIANVFKDFEIEGLEGLEDHRFEFSDAVNEGIEGLNSFVFNEDGQEQRWGWLTDEEREDLIDAQREAERAERNARREAKRAISRSERDRERVERDAERAAEQVLRDLERAERDQERAEREMERAEYQTERQHEFAERDFERAMEHAEAEAEQEMERAEREWERLTGAEAIEVDEQEMLEIQEKALLAAQADLEKQLNDIKRQRQDLKRQKRRTKTD